MRILPIGLATSATLVASLALTFSTASLAAQQLESHVVVGTIAYAMQPGTSGVFFVSLPTSTSPGGKVLPLQGKLPPQLSVGPGKRGGAYSVLRRPSDGTIFVGDAAGPGGVCHVHILRMAGPRVMGLRSVPVGVVPSSPKNSRTVQGLALLPDGRVMVAAGGSFMSGAMSGSPVAILDDRPKIPTITPIKLSVALAQPSVQGLALSPDGATAYLTVCAWSNHGTYPCLLYAMDLPSQATLSVTPKLLHTWKNRYVTKLTVDRNGVIYTTALDLAAKPAITTIEEIRIVNGKAAIKSTTFSVNAACIGPALERATGKHVFVSAYHQGMVKNNSVWMSGQNGKLSLLAGPPQGGWGMPASIDINNSFETYGMGSQSPDSYAFVDFPNPGGRPEVGNQGFSISVDSATGKPAVSLMVLGPTKVNLPVLGVPLLVSPLLVLPMTWNKGQATLPLPIPNNAGMKGMFLFAQSFHFGTALASSNGLRIDLQ